MSRGCAGIPIVPISGNTLLGKGEEINRVLFPIPLLKYLSYIYAGFDFMKFRTQT